MTSPNWRTELNRRKADCEIAVLGEKKCVGDEASQLFEAKFELEAVKRELVFQLEAYVYAQVSPSKTCHF